MTYALRVRRSPAQNALSCTDRAPERSQRTARPGRTRTVSHAVSHGGASLAGQFELEVVVPEPP
jgi:hypothetical protein